MLINEKNRIDESLDPEHHLIIGATGSGKTQFIKRHPFYTQSSKILAWDPEGSFDELPAYTTIKGLAMGLRRVLKYGDFHGRFIPAEPNEQNFEAFNQLVWECGHALNPITLIGEELADVAKTGKASKYWGFNSRKGRKYGTRILGVSQRPQEIDKTFINQCRFKWCGQLNSGADRRYMKNIMDISEDKLAALQECEFYYRVGAKPAQRGLLTF